MAHKTRDHALAGFAIRFIGRACRRGADAFRMQECAQSSKDAQLIRRLDERADFARRIGRAIAEGKGIALSPSELQPAFETLAVTVELLEKAIEDVQSLGEEISGEAGRRPRRRNLRVI